MKIALFALCNPYLAQGFVPTASVKTNYAPFSSVADELERFGEEFNRNQEETLTVLQEINQDFKKLVQFKRQALQEVDPTSVAVGPRDEDVAFNRIPISYFDSLYGKNASRRKDTVLHAQPKELEKEMRQELAERTSKVIDEEKYALRDGPLVPTTELEEASEVSDEGEIIPGETEGQRLKRRMDRLTKRRPYPLFLAEKGLELVEGIFPTQSSSPPTKKERVVLLGTGWGAVSFMKGIDTNLYDVTVISPRNYFLFTPMLGEWGIVCQDMPAHFVHFGFRLISLVLWIFSWSKRWNSRI
jgi:hypothetical protein